MSIFKPIISARHVETWVRDTLILWFPTYLKEYMLQNAIPLDPGMPLPRSYIIAEDVDREPGDQTPTLVVVSPGLANQPMMKGSGKYEASWQIGIGFFAEGMNRETTDALARHYLAIARAIMLQKGSLGQKAETTIWLDEDYDLMDFEEGRTIASGMSYFEVVVAEVVDRRGGPVGPPDPGGQPGSNWPTVDEVIIDVNKVPLTEEV